MYSYLTDFSFFLNTNSYAFRRIELIITLDIKIFIAFIVLLAMINKGPLF